MSFFDRLRDDSINAEAFDKASELNADFNSKVATVSTKVFAIQNKLSDIDGNIKKLDEEVKNLKWPQRHRAKHHREILANKGSAAVDAVIFNGVELEHPVNIMHKVTLYNGVKVGRWTYINVGTMVYRNVEIGRFCSIARDCEIGVGSKETGALTTHDFIYHDGLFPRHEEYSAFPKIKREEKKHEDINIGNDVWIGAKTIVMGGVKIGNGCVIGAGSIVTKDIPAYSIAVGVPAKVIKKRFSDEQIEKLEELKWWELDLEELKKVDFRNVDSAINILKEIRQVI